jgi:hypothetical protein
MGGIGMLQELIILILYCILGFILSSLVHELGHLLVSMILGWNFYFIVFGPFKITCNQDTRLLSLGFERNIQYWGGVVSCLPKGVEDDSGSTLRKVLIAGPIASLVLGVIMLSMFLFTDSIFLLTIAAESLGMGIITLLPVPLRTGIMYTDGYRYKRCHGSSQALLEEEALLSISLLENNLNDVTLEEVEKFISPLLISQDYIYRYFSYYYMYNQAKKRNLDEKLRYLTGVEEFREKVPKRIQRLLVFEE